MSARFVNIDHDTPMLLPPARQRKEPVEPVEPVLGIIKQAIRFRRFLLRGTEKAGLEWTLVTARPPN